MNGRCFGGNGGVDGDGGGGRSRWCVSVYDHKKLKKNTNVLVYPCLIIIMDPNSKYISFESITKSMYSMYLYFEFEIYQKPIESKCFNSINSFLV